jgi:hypothetical protein
MRHSVGYGYAVKKKYDGGDADKIRRRLDRFSTAAAPQKFDAARRRNSTAPGSTTGYLNSFNCCCRLGW